MAGKGIKGASKGRKKIKHPKQPKQVQEEKADGFTGHNFVKLQVGNAENNEELGTGESSSGNNRKLEENDVLGKYVNEILEDVKLTSSDRPRQVPLKFPPLSAAGYRLMKLVMEAKKINNPVHTPECGHPNLRRDIDDCGASNEIIAVNCERLLECYKEDNNDYPYILKKAFKYFKEHDVSIDAYYRKLPESDATHDGISEEVEGLRLTGFQMIDHKDENALMRAISKGPFMGGVRESPEFSVVGDGIYRGSDYEVVVDGKYCNHALMIVGSGTTELGGTKCWKVLNLQDPTWGVEGEGMIACDSSLPNHRKHLIMATMFPTFE